MLQVGRRESVVMSRSEVMVQVEEGRNCHKQQKSWRRFTCVICDAKLGKSRLGDFETT